MNEETIEKLLNPKHQGVNGRGIGVFNVHQRIRLHFGNEYGLSIESVVGMKTIFRIKWPKRR